MSGTPDFFCREAHRLGYVARSAFKLIQMQKQYKIISPGASVLDLGCAPGAWLQVACQNLGPLEKGGAVVGIDTKFGQEKIATNVKLAYLERILKGLSVKPKMSCRLVGCAAEQKVKVPPLHCDSRVKTVCSDVLKLPRGTVRALSPKAKGFSVILSDMCPLVSGITSRDAALSAELGMRALDLAVGKAAVDHTVNNVSLEVQSDSSALAQDAGRLLKPEGHLIIKLLESEDIKEFNQICKPLFRKASWLRPKATRSCSREIYLICQGLL